MNPYGLLHPAVFPIRVKRIDRTQPQIVSIYAGTSGKPPDSVTPYALWVPGVGPLRLTEPQVEQN